MTFQLPNEMVEQIDAQPTFLRVTPDGFSDGSSLRSELIAKPIDASIVVKLFEDNELVHTSEECNSDPKCPRCNDPRARKYVRLRVEAGGRLFQLDLPPTTVPHFAEVARDGIDGLLRMTCTRREQRGRTWGEVGFEVIGKEAA